MSALGGDPRLEARAVDVRRGGRPVLDGVDLQLHRGEVVALIGPNGAGKSTLLHLLAGDLRPDAGQVHLAGRDIRSYRHSELARVRSVLTQSNEVSFPFTVEEVVTMGRAPWRDDDAATSRAHVQGALRDAEVDHLAARRAPELSGGERARVAYARVRAQACDIVLLDEPTASLDIRHQERLLQQTRDHAARGGSVVVVLHDLNLAAAFADRIVLLESGRVRAADIPERALTAELLSSVYRHPIAVLPIEGTAGGAVIQPVRSCPSEKGAVSRA